LLKLLLSSVDIAEKTNERLVKAKAYFCMYIYILTYGNGRKAKEGLLNKEVIVVWSIA